MARSQGTSILATMCCGGWFACLCIVVVLIAICRGVCLCAVVRPQGGRKEDIPLEMYARSMDGMEAKLLKRVNGSNLLMYVLPVCVCPWYIPVWDTTVMRLLKYWVCRRCKCCACICGIPLGLQGCFFCTRYKLDFDHPTLFHLA